MRTPPTAIGFALAVALIFLAEGFASAFRDFPEPRAPNPVNLFWNECRQELTLLTKIIKGCLTEDMCRDLRDMKPNARVLTDDQMLEVVNNLPSHIMHAVIGCLRTHKVPIHDVKKKIGPGNWCMEHIKLSIHSNDVSRRFLAERAMQIMSSYFSSALPTATASFQSLAPSQLPLPPSPNIAQVQIPNTAPSPAPTPGLVPTALPVPGGHQKRNQSKDGQNPSPPPKSGNDASGGAVEAVTSVPSTQHKYSMNLVIAAVVLTGLTSFFIAACVFISYEKFVRRSNRSDSHKDEKPLLTLSLSDFSADSSSKSNGFGVSSDYDKNGKLSFKANQNPSLSGSVALSDVSENMFPSSAEASEVSNSAAGTPAPLSKPVSPPPPPTPPAAPPQPPPPKKGPPPGPPPPPPKSSAPLPPPPKGAAPPRLSGGFRKSPLGPSSSGKSSVEDSSADNASKTKLKPFFWDKVVAKPDQSMVWHQISSGSFQFNEEMIESLFGCSASDVQNNNAKKGSKHLGATVQQVQLLDPKKSQNLAILLRALNVKTEEVCEALMEGNELPSELLQTLLKMAPTPEEELKLRLYSGDLSQIGSAERFLKKLVDIPFAFKKLDALLYMGSLQEDMSTIKESFTTIETACKELRSSRLFLKLLEAVLKTGNRMNDGTYRGGAQAFKLDTLLKLSDVKGTDGKTTLLHFVVQEIVRSEGIKASRIANASSSFSGFSFKSDDLVDDTLDTDDYIWSLGLKVVAGLGNELQNVKKAAALDSDSLTSMAAILGHGLVKTKEFLEKDMKSINEDSEFHSSLECFVEHAEKDITSLLDDEKKICSLVKSTTDYFHGNTGKDEGLRLFVIVRDFLGMIEKVCNEIKQAPSKKVQKPPSNKEGITPRRILFPTIEEQQEDSDSNDDSS